jgi:hypothetical protein
VQEPRAAELKGGYINVVSRVALALTATILTPGFCDQAGNVGFRVAELAGLATPMLAKFFQLSMCQVAPQCVRREFICGFPMRTCRFIDFAQQVVRAKQPSGSGLLT